jgi:hypothetical protein
MWTRTGPGERAQKEPALTTHHLRYLTALKSFVVEATLSVTFCEVIPSKQESTRRRMLSGTAVILLLILGGFEGVGP